MMIIQSLPHEEYLDLGIATGYINVEMNWVGIVLGIIILIVIVVAIFNNNGN